MAAPLGNATVQVLCQSFHADWVAMLKKNAIIKSRQKKAVCFFKMSSALLYDVHRPLTPYLCVPMASN